MTPSAKSAAAIRVEGLFQFIDLTAECVGKEESGIQASDLESPVADMISSVVTP